MFGTYRTLLALMVVVLHLGGIPTIGSYAVFGFYTLSGYLMTLIMCQNYGYTVAGICRYGVNRVLRIYPIYWVSVALSVIIILYLGGEYTSDYHPAIYLPQGLSESLKNLLLFFPFRETPRLTPPAWALTVEIAYYIAIGLGLSRYKKVVLCWFVVSILYHVVGMVLGWDWPSRYYTIPAASLPFATGAMIFYYKAGVVKKMKFLSNDGPSYIPGLLFFCILLNWFIGHQLGYSRGIFFYTNYIICAVMIIVLSERKALPFISKKFDKWMGNLSYPIYLIHYQVGLIMLVLLGKMGLEYKRPDVMLMIYSLPLIFLVSWGFTVALEQPIELIRAKMKTEVKRTNRGG